MLTSTLTLCTHFKLYSGKEKIKKKKTRNKRKWGSKNVVIIRRPLSLFQRSPSGNDPYFRICVFFVLQVSPLSTTRPSLQSSRLHLRNTVIVVRERSFKSADVLVYIIYVENLFGKRQNKKNIWKKREKREREEERKSEQGRITTFADPRRWWMKMFSINKPLSIRTLTVGFMYNDEKLYDCS